MHLRHERCPAQGVLVYFGYPQAHEDDAERAVRAGQALVQAVRSVTAPEPVRIGIGTGLVVVGDLGSSGEAQERGVVSETPNFSRATRPTIGATSPRLRWLTLSVAPRALIDARLRWRRGGG